MNLREALLQTGAEIKEVLERQVGMKAADDVELRNGLGIAGSGRLKGFFERHGVGAGGIFLSTKRTQPASSHTHIRGIDVAIDVEISSVAMQPLAYGVYCSVPGTPLPPSAAKSREQTT